MCMFALGLDLFCCVSAKTKCCHSDQIHATVYLVVMDSMLVLEQSTDASKRTESGCGRVFHSPDKAPLVCRGKLAFQVLC